MSFILDYLARMILISGFLLGYYWVFLRNAPFHQYNRCYLIGILVLALTLPLMHMPIEGLGNGNLTSQAIAALHEITTGNWGESGRLTNNPGLSRAFLGFQDLGYGIYFPVTSVLLAVFIRRIHYIIRLSGRCPQERVERIRIFFSTEPGTPFSFLRMIFWNSRLDINSPHGKQVFRHELYHVRQNHSVDILILEFFRRVFWFNPFFHLICKEVKATHEFLADRYAITCSDKFEYAELLVQHAVGTHSPMPTHSFFNTHLKRRISMLTQLRNNRPGYFSRILVLPVAFLLFCAFATKVKMQNHFVNPSPPKTINVVIDAGHGGIDAGAISSSGVNEKDITLAIARKVKQFSSSYNINVLMTREDDQMPGNKSSIQEGLHYRTDFANQHKADLFISLHVNAGTGYADKGMTIYLSEQNPYFQKSMSLGLAISEEMKKTYSTNEGLRKRQQTIWVLKASAMPAIMVLCGNLDNVKDLSFISNEHNQEKIARSILQGVLRYEGNLSDK